MSDIAYGSGNEAGLPPINLPRFDAGNQRPQIVINRAPTTPSFDPSLPFNVEGGTGAQPSSAAPASQFDASKPFDILPNDPAQAYQAGRDKVRAARDAATTTDPSQQLAIDFNNQGSAAAQGTTPNVQAQQPNLISDNVYQNDAGEMQYKDPATGQLVPTDQNKHVILVDPTDNKMKVFGRTDDTNESKISSAGRILMTGMGSGAPTVRPAVPISKIAAPTIDALITAAKGGFEAPEVAALTLKPSVLTNFAQTLGSKLNEIGLDENLAPKTFGIIKKASEAPEGAVVTGKNVVSMRRMLGNAAGSIDPVERKAAKTSIDAVDEFMGNLSHSDVISGDAKAAAGKLEEARGNYSAAKTGELLDKKRVRAELRAAAANSGQNISNTLRQRLADILLNEKDRRGFSISEIKMMERIVKGSATQSTLRTAGNFLGGGGGLGAMASSAIGAYFTGGAGAVTPLVGAAMKHLGDILTIRQIEKLSEAVRADSPLARSIGNSLQDWSKSADAMKVPNGPKIARFVMASKNLMSNLKDAGISVRLPDFVKSIQGTSDSDAQDK